MKNFLLARLNLYFVFFLLFNGCAKIEDFELLSPEGTSVPFMALAGDSPLVVLFLSDPKSCSCALDDFSKELFDEGKKGVHFLTVINSGKTDVAEQYLNANRDRLIGDVFFDSGGGLSKKYAIGDGNVLCFINKGGSLAGMIPADIKEKNVLGIARIMVNKI